MCVLTQDMVHSGTIINFKKSDHYSSLFVLCFRTNRYKTYLRNNNYSNFFFFPEVPQGGAAPTLKTTDFFFYVHWISNVPFNSVSPRQGPVSAGRSLSPLVLLVSKPTYLS